MKVSVITIVFNNKLTIKDTIDSVQKQGYPDVEHIIVDGGSTDGTVEIIEDSLHYNTKFISEKDNGLYDALNKGIGLATGDVIGILHSDDVFNSSNIISDVVNAFEQHEVDSIYGDLVYVNRFKSEKVIRNWVSGTYSKKKFQKGWMPPHPTFYVKRVIFEKFGAYDTDFKSAADYELMLRFLYKYEISSYYIPKVLVRMRVGGESNKSLKNRLLANREDYIAWKKNNLNPSEYLRILKPLIKIPQYISFANIKSFAYNSLF